jgi:hypothetical protein
MDPPAARSNGWPLGTRASAVRRQNKLNACAMIYNGDGRRSAADTSPEITASRLRAQFASLDDEQATDLASSLHKSWNAEDRKRAETVAHLAKDCARRGGSVDDLIALFTAHGFADDALQASATILDEVRRDREEFVASVDAVEMSDVAGDSAVVLCRTLDETHADTAERLEREGLGWVAAEKEALRIRAEERAVVFTAKAAVCVEREFDRLCLDEKLSAPAARALLSDRGWPVPTCSTTAPPEARAEAIRQWQIERDIEGARAMREADAHNTRMAAQAPGRYYR